MLSIGDRPWSASPSRRVWRPAVLRIARTSRDGPRARDPSAAPARWSSGRSRKAGGDPKSVPARWHLAEGKRSTSSCRCRAPDGRLIEHGRMVFLLEETRNRSGPTSSRRSTTSSTAIRRRGRSRATRGCSARPSASTGSRSPRSATSDRRDRRAWLRFRRRAVEDPRRRRPSRAAIPRTASRSGSGRRPLPRARDDASSSSACAIAAGNVTPIALEARAL